MASKTDFSGGVTLIDRIPMESVAVLDRCSGYKIDRRALVPDDLAEKINTGVALGETVPEQTPAPFLDGGVKRLIAVDSNKTLRELINGEWGAAGPICNVLADGVPCRMGKQVIFPTGGPFADLMVYEPQSLSTKLRKLSLWAPTDYTPSAKPTVTPSVDSRVSLFNCDDANAWTSAHGSTAVDNSGVATTVFTFDDSTPQGTQLAKKSLGDGILLTGKEWLILDVVINNDDQLYSYSGLFANNTGLYPSGYKIRLFSDVNCTTELASFHIPRVTPAGKVNRIAFKLASSSATVRGVSIDSATFFTKPTTGETASLTLYSNAFSDDWKLPGNWLAPAVVYPLSPWVDDLDDVVSADSDFTKIPGNNLVTNPSFESGATAWTLGGAGEPAVIATYNPRTGSKFVHMDYGNVWVQHSAINVTAGIEYLFQYWWYAKSEGMATWATLTFNDPGATVIRFPESGTIKGNDIYQCISTNFTVPAGATAVTLRIWADGYHHLSSQWDGIDDVFLGLLDQTTPKTVVELQVFAPDGTGRDPLDHLVRYSYSYAGRDLLSVDSYKVMISNPSEVSTPDTLADPWRSYTVTAVMPAGMVTGIAAAPTAGGAGYVVGDVLEVSAGGTGAKVKVLAINAGTVTSVEFIARGVGYTAGAGLATTAISGAGAGCTIEITAVSDHLPIDEYGDYLTAVLFYRQRYDGASGVWSDWEYIGNAPIGQSVSFVDTGTTPGEDTALLNGHPVPLVREINNARASSAKVVIYYGGRVISACLDWDETTERWTRPTAIQISSLNKPWAHPSIPDLSTDGTELDNYMMSGSEVCGMAILNDDLIVNLDNEVFLARGDASNGYRFFRLGPVGSISARSEAQGIDSLYWHNGHHFQQCSGGIPKAISMFAIDSSLIDWTKPHGAVYWDDKYIFFCTHDSQHALMIYDVILQAWRVRYSDALDLVGICTDGQVVYGVTPGGDAVSLFGGSSDYGAASVVREVWTKYILVAPAGEDAHIGRAVFDIDCPVDCEISLKFLVHGLKRGSVNRTLSVSASKTRQEERVNLKGDAVQVQMSYTGTTPPTIYSIGLVVDEGVQR